MKNKTGAFSKTLTALYAIFGAIITVLCVIALFAGAELSAFGYVIKLADGVWSRIVAIVAGLIMLFWAYEVFVNAVGYNAKENRSSVTLSNGENGDVRISIQAMDSLVRRAIGDLSGIANIKTNVLGNDDSISVQVSMALESDVHIPNVTMLLQRTVKNFIEEYSGIAVRDVTVEVTSVAEPIVVPKQLAIETLPKNPQTNSVTDAPEELQKNDVVTRTQLPETESVIVEEQPEQVVEETVIQPQDDNEEKIDEAKETTVILSEKEEETKPVPDNGVSDFVLSDGLPEIDDFDDHISDSDFDFSGYEQASGENADYYSPYETSATDIKADKEEDKKDQ